MCKGVHEHALGEIGTRDSLYLFCNSHKQSPCVECSGQQQVPGRGGGGRGVEWEGWEVGEKEKVRA